MTMLTPELRHEIDNLLAETPVVLFMKGTPQQPMCGFSARAVSLLQQTGVAFTSVDILEREDLRAGMKEYGDWPTFPQLYVRGELIGGCDIMVEMHQAGELAGVLQA